MTIALSESQTASIIDLRRSKGLADHEIAHRLNLSEWAVRRTLRDHRRDHPDDLLPAHRWSAQSPAMRRMKLANDLLVENKLLHSEILQRTNYGSWRSLLDAVRTYRTRMNLKPLQHTTGWLKVAENRGGKDVRIVVCADAIKSAGWRKGQRIRWTVHEGEIWLSPQERLTKELVCWKPDDPDAEVYFQKYVLKKAWRTLAKEMEKSMTTLMQMARAHATRHPWIPAGERPRNEPRGTAMVMLINESTLRLNLDRAARLAGLKASDQVRWERRAKHLLVLRHDDLTDAQASA